MRRHGGHWAGEGRASAGHSLWVDEQATGELRERLRAERGQTKLFDFGPPIEHLRERCLEETGLPAPKPPVFRAVTEGATSAA